MTMRVVATYEPLIPSPDGNVAVNYVLTEDTVGKFAVYVGIGDKNFVASSGVKLSYETARCYYPNLTRDKYRA